MKDKYVYLLAAGIVLFAFPCVAADFSYECNLSGTAGGSDLSACPNDNSGGPGTSTKAVTTDGSTCTATSYCGARSDTPVAMSPIDVWDHCRWVDNNSSNAIFVPFRKSNEWEAFITGAPSYVSLVHCALPYSINPLLPATSTVSPPYVGCTSTTVDNPNVYGRADVSVWPQSPISKVFACHSGGTLVTSQIQWKAGDSEPTSSNGARITDALTWIKNVKFSSDLIMTAKNEVSGTSGSSITLTTGDAITLHWTIGTDTVSCVASSSLEDWIGNVAPVDGSITFDSIGSGTYTLACTASNGLVSTATVTFDAGKCGSDANKSLINTPINLCSAGNTPSALTTTSNSWNWTCSPADGSAASPCLATLRAAQCGTDAKVNVDDGSTSGTLCVYGTPSHVSTANGTYTCTTGPGTPKNVAYCTAAGSAQGGPCIPVGEPVPRGQTQCPTDACFFQVSGGSLQGAVESTSSGYLDDIDDIYAPVPYYGFPSGDIVGPGDYRVTSPFKGYDGTGDFRDPSGYSSRNYPFLYSDAQTFDSMVLGPKTHVIIYKGQDYTGGIWIDVHGPKAIYNMLSFEPLCSQEDSTMYCIEPVPYGYIFNDDWPDAPDFPPSERYKSGVNMHLWGRGTSVKVSCDP